MDAKRLILLLSILLISACTNVTKKLQPVLDTRVKTIEIAKIETNKFLLIQQVNPVIAAMGTSGMLLDAVILTQRAHEYEEKAGPVREMSLKTFKKALLIALSKKGFKARSSERYYWDYYKGDQKSKTRGIDAILKIELKNLGFWSKSPMDPYQPSILVIAELIDPSSRKILYSDRFSLGIDITSLQMMKLMHGKINMAPNMYKPSYYSDYGRLLKKSDQSRNALMKVVTAAALHISKSLNGEKRYITRSYEKSAAQINMATSDHMIIGVNRANIRKAPNRNGKILFKLKKGTVVTKMSKRGKWFFIRLDDGKTAWAHHSVFVKRNKINFVAEKKVARNKLVVEAKVACMRKRPSREGREIQRLKQGSVVTKLRRQGEWFYVRMEKGGNAWAHKSVF